MASSLRTKARIAASVLFATGFFDAIAGRFLFQAGARLRRGDETGAGGQEWRDLAGAVHVHTTYSDGAGDVPTVMEAARRAGVDWLLLADHNTQRPRRDGWEARYENSPLLLIGTEVTVEHGAFLLALDMPAAWEPTKNHKPQTAVDEVRAHGGIPLISLPFDIKHPWRDWGAVGCDGLEVINFSTIARRHINVLSLLWLLAVHRFGGGTPAVIRALVTRPDQALARWDALTRHGAASVGIGALDAHALMKIGRKKYPIPSYEESFRATTTHILLPRNAAVTRAAIYDALRAGRCYFSYDCLGDPSGFTFTARYGNDKGVTLPMGAKVHANNGGVVLEARAPDDRTLLRLYRQGRIVAAGCDNLSVRVTEPGAYRVEVYRYASKFGPFVMGARPWIFSNPVYVS